MGLVPTFEKNYPKSSPALYWLKTFLTPNKYHALYETSSLVFEKQTLCDWLLGSIHLHGELFRYIAKYFANERNILLLSKMLFSKDDKNFAI